MRPSRGDLVLILGGVAAAACLTVAGGFELPELLFFSVMLTWLALLSCAGRRAWGRARAARKDAVEVSRIRPDQVAADAVRDERRRLSEDIAAELRAMLTQVRREAAHPDDPGATARRIHRHAQLASSELRRLLGLLRTGESSQVEVLPVRHGEGTGLSRRDVAFAGAAGALALGESIAYPLAENQDIGWWSVALTVATAVIVLGRTSCPALAAVAASALVGLGAASEQGVTGGFWMLITVTGLAWGAVGAPDAPARRTCAGLLFAATVITSAWVSDRENAMATTLVVCVLFAVALLVRVGRARGQRAMRAAARHRSSLAEAAATAVEADRVAFAREIHDSVSHAVGLIAMQAGAAEVSHRRDPDAARQALQLIEGTAADALVDLDLLHPDASTRRRTPRDVAALVARIRAAGTPVTAVGLDRLPVNGSEVVYRIVQEALTNVVRHGLGAPAQVTVDVAPDLLTVTIADDGPGPVRSSEHGFGLVGLTERVRHAGGSLRTGPGADGRGFVVEATLPASRVGVR